MCSNLLLPSVLEATVTRTRTPAAGSSTSLTSAPSPGPSTGSSSRPAIRPSDALGAAGSRSATMATVRGGAPRPRAPHCLSCTWWRRASTRRSRWPSSPTWSWKGAPAPWTTSLSSESSWEKQSAFVLKECHCNCSCCAVGFKKWHKKYFLFKLTFHGEWHRKKLPTQALFFKKKTNYF